VGETKGDSMLSGMKILLILAIVLIFFGAGKLPKVMGDLGKGLRSFREGLNGKDEPEALPQPVPLTDQRDRKDDHTPVA
jgi:sec-independent protein translocase protein TatA